MENESLFEILEGQMNSTHLSTTQPMMLSGDALLRIYIGVLILFILIAGCAHYPINDSLESLTSKTERRNKSLNVPGSSEKLHVILTFSGGGTRAAAFSYGVLEELARTELSIDGKKRRLLDEVDSISGVSGGSFTAAYYGLYGNRIFEDFESRFLKENVQKQLLVRTLLYPHNWFRLLSPHFGRSDLAAEYYDKYVFEGGVFADINARKGPLIVINATDMTYGGWFTFTPNIFDVICSDLASMRVARAVAASSAVPGALSPITLRNYAGSCGFVMPERLRNALERPEEMQAVYHLALQVEAYLDVKKKPYIHLVDGGVADNLGLRAGIDRINLSDDFWSSLKYLGLDDVQKIVIIVVNAEPGIDLSWDLREKPPSSLETLGSFSSVAISRYNYETLNLLRKIFKQWAKEIRKGRCRERGEVISADPGSCGDIAFYMVEVDFDALQDDEERHYMKSLPTSFVLPPEDIDHLRDVAHRVLNQSEEFQRLLKDLR
jgi:NTE family protein